MPMKHRDASNLVSRLSRVCTTLVMGVVGVVAFSACGGSDNGMNASTPFQQTNLVSDIPGMAAHTDPNLVNPWGIVHGASTPFWISDNGQGVSTLYDGSGAPFPSTTPRVVTIPPPVGSDPGTTAAPTGIVVNATADFMVSNGTTSGAALFIFATEDGTISGWNQNVDMGVAILTADNSANGAIYKGLAMASSGGANFLYATNFNAGTIDVFDRTFAKATLAGSFSDPTIPAGFAPFGIQAIGTNLYITYAKQDDEKHDDVKGAGNGYVDVFDTSGHLLARFASQGPLNSPWGVALAPAMFGTFSNAILVGNFGDGRINAFDPSSHRFLGQLVDMHQSPITISGLWGLSFGGGANAGDANTLLFTAGLDDEAHGLFGSLQAMSG